jgi:hypothetical protein
MTHNSDRPSIHLRSDRLAVEIAAPGTVYRGTRFDWTGFITQVTLDGQHTFCVPESLQPGRGTGGVGLCNEFGNEMAIGYADAQPGDLFPKLGIGLLTRPDEAQYSFLRPYAIAQPFPIRVETAPDRVHFAVEPLDCRGYAVRLDKTVTVEGSQLQIAYRLENVGRRPIATREYGHNFLGIDGHLLGPDYRLRVPYPIALEKISGMLRQVLPGVLGKIVPRFLLDKVEEMLLRRMVRILAIEGRDLHCRATPRGPFYCRLRGYTQTRQPQWELVHLPSGVGVHEVDDFAPVRVAVWGTTHVISAEVFVEIRLGPGKVQTWSRQYTFFAAQGG